MFHISLTIISKKQRNIYITTIDSLKVVKRPICLRYILNIFTPAGFPLKQPKSNHAVQHVVTKSNEPVSQLLESGKLCT